MYLVIKEILNNNVKQKWNFNYHELSKIDKTKTLI